MPASTPHSGRPGAAGSPGTRGDLLLYLAPGTGMVAMVVSWLIAVGRIRESVEELGVQLPLLTRVLVDHGGAITTVAALVTVLGLAAIRLVRRRAVQVGISIVMSLIAFGLLAWDLVVFWLVYVGTLEGIG